MSITTQIWCGPSGKTLIFLFADSSTGADANISALGSVPVLKKDGVPVPLQATSGQTNTPMYGPTGLLPWAIYRVDAGTPIVAGHTWTVDAPAGWMTLTSGPAPALSGAPVDLTPLASGMITGPVAKTSKAMQVGTNIEFDQYSEPVCQRGDFGRRMRPLWTGTGGTPVVDSLSNITDMNGASYATAQVVTRVANGSSPDDQKGCRQAPNGTYTHRWHGGFNQAGLQLVNVTKPSGTAGNPGYIDSNGFVTPDSPVAVPADIPYTNGFGASIRGGDASGAYLRSASNPNYHPAGGASGAAGTGPFAILAWYRPTALVAESNLHQILGKYGRGTTSSGTSGQKEFYFGVSNGNPVFHCSSNGNLDTLVTGATASKPTQQVWNCLIAWYDGTTMYTGRILNGVVVGQNSGAQSAVWSGQSALDIGPGHGYTGTPSYDVDCVTVVKFVPTAGEIAAFWNNGTALHSDAFGSGSLSRFTAANGLLCYDFDESAGSSRNSSANSVVSIPLLETNVSGTGGTTVAQCVGAEPVPQTENVATYTLTDSNSNGTSTVGYGPQINVWVTAAGQTNHRIYPPGVATDGSQHWAPSAVRRLGRPYVGRVGQAARINAAGTANYTLWSDCQGNNGAGPGDGAGTRSTTVNIGSISAPTGANAGFTTYSNYQLIQFNNPGHGLEDGIWLNWNASGTVTMQDASTFTIPSGSYQIRTADPDSFVGVFLRSAGQGTVAGTQTLSGTATATYGQGTPIPALLDLFDAVGANYWVQTPHNMPDDQLRLYFDYVAGRLPAGKTCRVEYSNEHWNFNLLFWQDFYFLSNGTNSPSGTIPNNLGTTGWYAARAAQVHAIAAERFALAGRSADLIRVFGSQCSSTAVTTALLNYCAANDVQVDEVAIAPYWDCGPNDSSLAATYDLLTNSGADPDPLMDVTEMMIAHGGGYNTPYTPCGRVQAHVAVINSFPAYAGKTKLVCYEGGHQYGGGRGTISAGAKAQLSWMWNRHPRMHGIYLKFLQKIQDEGASLFVDFAAATHSGPSNSGWGTIANAAMYSKYKGYAMNPGIGDGSDGQFDNRTNYFAMDSVVAPAGHALNVWQALAGSSARGSVAVTPPSGGVKSGVAGTFAFGAASPSRTLAPYASDSGTWSAATLAGGAGGESASFTPAASGQQSADSAAVAYLLSDDGSAYGASPIFSTGLTVPAAARPKWFPGMDRRWRARHRPRMR